MSKLKISCGLLVFATTLANAIAGVATYGTGVTGTGTGGLCNSAGSVVDSGVSVSSASFGVSYTGTFGVSGTTVTDTYKSFTRTEVKILFTSNSWHTAPSTAVVGIQAANFWHIATVPANPTVTLVDYFSTPTVGGSTLFSITAHTGMPFTYTFDVNYSDVNPRLFQVNMGTVDSSDTTGKTADFIYASSQVPTPWAQLTDPYSNSYNGSTQNAGMLPVCWLFAKPTATGVAFAPSEDYPLTGC